MKPGWQIDGQKRPREPDKPISLLDSAGIDLRMVPQPEVYEYSTFGPWYECGGDWLDTQLMDDL